MVIAAVSLANQATGLATRFSGNTQQRQQFAPATVDTFTRNQAVKPQFGQKNGIMLLLGAIAIGGAIIHNRISK